MTVTAAVNAVLARKNKDTRIAVVGASNDPSKFGYRIVSVLQAMGYTVIPVNPKGGEVLGLPAAVSLEAIDGRLDIVDLVVPPPVAAQVVRRLSPDKVGVVWFQPGSESADAVAEAQSRFEHVVTVDCIMPSARAA